MKIRFNGVPGRGSWLSVEFGIYTLLLFVRPRTWLWGYEDFEYECIESWGCGPLFLLTRTPGRPLK